MENFAVISAFMLGLFGSVFSVVQFFYQRHKDKAQTKIDAAREAARDKAQAERDKAQDLKDRLTFLTQVIIDRDIPRESRQPFFEEYIQKGGNGTVVKFWLENK